MGRRGRVGGLVISKSDPGGGRSEGVGNFYKAVAQSVFLFAVETWVLAPRMEQDLEFFKNRVASRITRKQQWRQRTDRIWGYPPLAEALREAGFKGIIKSVTRTQNTVAQYIAM